MPTAFANFFSHLLSINAGARISFPEMSHAVAAETSSNDIRCRIQTAVLPSFKVLCGALKALRLGGLYLVGSAKRSEIIFPHRQAAVIAAAQLSKVSGFSIAD